MALDDVKQSIISNVTNAYEKALDKGATEPENKNLENLAATIDSIQGGTTLGYHVRSVINPDGETQTLRITSGENITLQDKTATPSEETQTITADEGYFAIENMTVEAIPSDYVGSGVQKLEETTYTPTTTDIVISANQYLEGIQTIKGDVNLVPENIAKDVELFGVVGTHAGGGGETGGMGDALNEGVAEINDAVGDVTDLRQRAFTQSSILTKVSFPACKTVGSSAFMACSNLTDVYLPNAESFFAGAFMSCSRLLSVRFPKLLEIGSYCFSSCIKLIDIYAPLVQTIGDNAFYSNKSLAKIDFPACTTIGARVFLDVSKATVLNMPELVSTGDAAFFHCDYLENVQLPKLASVASTAFAYCSRLTTIDLPVCSIIHSSAFYLTPKLSSINIPQCHTLSTGAFNNASVSVANLPMCENIGASAFNYCTKLSRVILGKSNCGLAHSNAFNGTPMIQSSYLGYFGSIYVPDEYVDAYKTSRYWSYYADRITGISNLPTE